MNSKAMPGSREKVKNRRPGCRWWVVSRSLDLCEWRGKGKKKKSFGDFTARRDSELPNGGGG